MSNGSNHYDYVFTLKGGEMRSSGSNSFRDNAVAMYHIYSTHDITRLSVGAAQHHAAPFIGMEDGKDETNANST